LKIIQNNYVKGKYTDYIVELQNMVYKK